MQKSIRRFRAKNKRMKKEIDEIQREINAIIESNEEDKKTRDRVKTIKGVGDRLVGAIIGIMDSYKGFESAKEAASYVGITPTLKQSGESVKKRGNISKMGNKYIRSLLVMCARSAMKYNPQCKVLNDRLGSKGKKYCERSVAVEHKLLRQTYGVIKNGQNYDVNYVAKKQEIFVSA